MGRCRALSKPGDLDLIFYVQIYVNVLELDFGTRTHHRAITYQIILAYCDLVYRCPVGRCRALSKPGDLDLIFYVRIYVDMLELDFGTRTHRRAIT